MTSHRLGENIFTKYKSDIALKNKQSVLKIEKKNSGQMSKQRDN